MKRDRPAKEYQDHREIHRIARKAIQPDDDELLGRRPGRQGTAARHVEISNGPQQQDHSHCERKKPKSIEKSERLGAQATTAEPQTQPCLGAAEPRPELARTDRKSRHFFATRFALCVECPAFQADGLGTRSFTEGSSPSPSLRGDALSSSARRRARPSTRAAGSSCRGRRRCRGRPLPFDHDAAAAANEHLAEGTGRRRHRHDEGGAPVDGLREVLRLDGWHPQLPQTDSPTLARSRPAGSRTSGIGPCIRLAVCPAASNSVTTIGAIRITAACPSTSSGTSRSRMPSASITWRNRVVSAVTRAAWRPCTDIVVRTAPFGRKLGNTTANPARVLAASGVSTLSRAVFEDLRPLADGCGRQAVGPRQRRVWLRRDRHEAHVAEEQRNESANMCTNGSISRKQSQRRSRGPLRPSSTAVERARNSADYCPGARPGDDEVAVRIASKRVKGKFRHLIHQRSSTPARRDAGSCRR